MAVRVFLFLFLHALIYDISANWFGSFGGSRTTALRVVAPTLARSALFENISGAYLYATLVSALPLYVSAAGRSRRLQPLVSRIPLDLGAVLIAAIWFLLAVSLLTASARFIIFFAELRRLEHRTRVRYRSANRSFAIRNHMKKLLYFFGLLTSLAACGSSATQEGGFLREVPEEVVALAAPNQNLQAVKLLEEDGCYWYRHVGPVETTLLPLLSKRGRRICTEKQT